MSASAFLVRLVAAMFALTLLSAPSAIAQTAIPGMQTQTPAQQSEPMGDPSPNDVREFMRLLSDPQMVEWLKTRAAETGMDADGALDETYREMVTRALAGARKRMNAIAGAFASLPQGIAALQDKAYEVVPPGKGLRAATYFLIFLFVGAGLEWLFWQYFQALNLRIEISHPSTLSRRFAAALARAALAAAAVAIFALGSVGTFLAFDWPPLLESMIIDFLLAVVVLRAAMALSVFLFAPRVSRMRLVPLSDAGARQVHRWTIATATVWIAGLLISNGVRRMAMATGSDPSGLATAEAVAGIAGIVISLVVIAGIWRLSPQVREAEDMTATGTHRLHAHKLMPIVQTALIVLIMISWFTGIYPVTGTLIIVALIGPLLHLAQVLVNHFYDEAEKHEISQAAARPAETDGNGDVPAEADEPDQTVAPARLYDYQRPIVLRLARLLVIVAAILALGAVWGVNILTLSGSSTGPGRIVGVIVDISAALLIADLIWTWSKTAIDRKMAETGSIQNELGPGPEARMLTLLPIFRMTLLIVLLIIVGLTLLSSLGVNIAPLLAGAGVVGIAIGFGAQALVRDVVSGIFFLLDDAFRVGEYIEMDNLRGTVESMSLRSLKVRHHRGAVHTIPFGELKSLTNYSRDWVMMKLEFRVPFDTDLMLVKKIVKRVGAELKAHENYGKHIIETLKSQGVRRMEEFNMVVGVKFMAKPGAQWVIRRDAYQKLRDEFEKNGISFAERNVKVQVVADQPLSEEQKEAAIGAAQDAIEKQMGPEAAAPPPDEP